MEHRSKICLLLLALTCLSAITSCQTTNKAKMVPIAFGWAKNSVNTVVFRKNAIVTHDDVQYAAFYDQEQYVTLAKRKLKEKKWKIVQTSYKGDAADAHTAISIMVDGDGYLHVAWGHHNNPLHYAKYLGIRRDNTDDRFERR